MSDSTSSVFGELVVPVAATVAALVLLTSPAWAHSPSDDAEALGSAKVVRWVDGDTVVTSLGKVDLVGVDAPELDDCGGLEAREVSTEAAPPGSSVQLAHPTREEGIFPIAGVVEVLEAREPEKLTKGETWSRFVIAGDRELGEVQLTRGAVARYDARDGHVRHRLQFQYRQLDAEYDDYCDPTTTRPAVEDEGSAHTGPNGSE